MDYSRDVFVFLLAGGKGERLYPLTKKRAKPAVPFGGKFRIIDFTLSNCVNSQFRKIAVITQYKSSSLHRHLALGWDFLSSRFGEYIVDVPPQQIYGERWYLGTADAVYQNLYYIEQENPKYVVVLSGDHIYKMDYRKMIEEHIANNADITIGSIIAGKEKSTFFGVLKVGNTGWVEDFKEKPKSPPVIPDNPEKILASMGVYVFNTRVLLDLLIHDAEVSSSSHDFGKDIIPYAIHNKYKTFAYRFTDKEGKESYWRDVGTLDSFYESNMDILTEAPLIDIYDRNWPVFTHSRQYPPSKITSGRLHGESIASHVEDSIVGEGSLLSGVHVKHSIIFYNVKIKAGSSIEDSIIFGGVKIGNNVRIKRCIIDKEVEIPDNVSIGFDVETDKKYFYVTPTNIVVIEKGFKFPKSLLGGSGEEEI
ncbi:MAG: glucose-1-phosphate adenylyltransferase [Caldisericaceae bacterium]